MFNFKNLQHIKQNYNLFGTSSNTLQFINLRKNDIFPMQNKAIMKKTPTTLIVLSGKLVVNLYDQKKRKEISLFAEDASLSTLYNSDNIIYTNKKYAITIYTGIFYSFYAYDNTLFQLLYNSDSSINHYTFSKNNKYFLTDTEYINLT